MEIYPWTGWPATCQQWALYIQGDTIMLHKGSFVKLRLSDIQSVSRRKVTFPTRLSVTLIQRRHVIMKNLFDGAMANQVKTRLGKLEPRSERRWGKMTAAQMLAHCSVSMQGAVGELVLEKGAPPAPLMGRLDKLI